jgi:hypothetical protein
MVEKSKSAKKTQQLSLRREIVWALAFKAIALVALYVLFFHPSHRVDVTANQVASAIVGCTQINERP